MKIGSQILIANNIEVKELQEYLNKLNERNYLIRLNETKQMDKQPWKRPIS